MKKIAIIDMGTNTFHLLIADLSYPQDPIIHRSHIAVKIGKGGINEDIITQSAFNRALDAMQNFRKTIDEFKVPTIYAFGTSALRNATNARELIEKILALTSIRVDVISGDAEADYIYAGVMSALDFGQETNLVMDIGAGSVEFIIGNRGNIFWKKSYEIGGQRLLERFQRHDPITQEEIRNLDAFFDATLTDLLQACKAFKPSVLAGSSGSFDTLSDIFCIRNGIPRTYRERETPLSTQGFFEIYGELTRKNRDERMQIPGMIEMRVDMIVVACCLIRFILERHHFENIRVSTYSLKEGALAKLASDAL
jgi:exopolyphosphatase/guanosine-5'-triphosphate,3'-diphosphate pyrophosphatase